LLAEARGYLVYLGARRGLEGPLLWPAIALHAALTIMLIRSWFVGSQSGSAPAGKRMNKG
jgi:hypothetical protein